MTRSPTTGRQDNGFLFTQSHDLKLTNEKAQILDQLHKNLIFKLRQNTNIFFQDYFHSLYQSVHSSLERTLNRNESDESQDESSTDESSSKNDSEYEKPASGETTPTDVTQVYF